MEIEKLSTDQELVLQTRCDKHAFVWIVKRYQDKIARYIFRLWVSDDKLDDILQEIFIKAYLHINDYEEFSSFSSWLYRIAHNEVISFFRKENRRISDIEISDEDFDIFEKIPSEIDVAWDIRSRDTAYKMKKALDSLEQKYRDALILKFFEDKSYEEISDILRIPPGTVATLINRGKAQLREIVEETKI